MTRAGYRGPEPNLPRAGRARLDRFSGTGVRSSLLSVPSSFGLQTVGFEPVGDVMGCIAFRVSHQYLGRCGTQSGRPPRVAFATTTGSSAGSAVRQLRGAYTTALTRLRAEATALAADGVVGIRLELRQHEDLHELVALGTAVRARTRTRTPRPFTTDLGGADVARLLLAGWAPVTLVTSVQIGLRHDDPVTMTQAGAGLGRRPNVEVTGYSELRQAVVSSARALFARSVSSAGADGALLSGLAVTHWHTACQMQLTGSDHAMRAVMTGSAVARFGSGERRLPSTLSILPVGTTERRVT